MRIMGEAIRVGDYKLALDRLESSYQNHDYWLLFIGVDPEMDPIRPDPQFQAMVKLLGVGWPAKLQSAAIAAQSTAAESADRRSLLRQSAAQSECANRARLLRWPYRPPDSRPG